MFLRALTVGVSATFLLACGRSSGNDPDTPTNLIAAGDGGEDDASPDGSVATDGDAAIQARCPASPDQPCSGEGTVCEYGADPSSNCNTLGTCRDGGLILRGPMMASCPTVDAGIGPSCSFYGDNSFGARDGGAVCTVGTVCDFPQGRCACVGAPVVAWNCVQPAPGCPAVRPRLGWACSGQEEVCDYSACGVLPDDAAQVCVGGVWTPTPEHACPAH